MFKDVNGKFSMKRFVGFGTALILWFVAIYAVISGHTDNIYNVLWPLVGLTAGAVGVTVFEKKV